MNVLIDDHLLREVIFDREPFWLSEARGPGQLATTGLWYFRLYSALRASRTTGAVSGPVTGLPEDLRSQVLGQVAALPGEIHLLSPGQISWPAGGTPRLTGSAIATSLGNLPPRLAAAAESESVSVLSPR